MYRLTAFFKKKITRRARSQKKVRRAAAKCMKTTNFKVKPNRDVYKTKYDTSFSVKYGQIVEMSDWIINQFRHFWIENIT